MFQKNLMIGYLLDFYGELLSGRKKDVLEMYYNEDLSLAEIGENCGLTRQGVSDSIRRTVAELYALEASLGIYAKSERVMALAAEILACGDIAKAHRLAEQITGEL